MSKHVHSAKLIWRDLQVNPKELHLDTLKCGQTFRWRHANDLWSCVLNGKLYTLKQTSSTVLYGILPEHEPEEQQMKSTLRDYFQLDQTSLEQCYQRWSRLDKNFKEKAPYFQGIRMLRQNPWENLISFICSSNNNIARISKMVQNLCIHYGPEIVTLDGVTYYDFPSIETLAKLKKGVLEEKLRQLGFGYRAKYIAQTTLQVYAKEQEQKDWLMSLRHASYSDAKQALVSLSGVGSKVADCVCLMSLDHPEAIPVDTHVWQIALRDYGFGNKKGKTLTTRLYDEVGDHFRQLFGDYSGWAHSVLFTADLRAFEDRLRDVKKEDNDNKDVSIGQEESTTMATTMATTTMDGTHHNDKKKVMIKKGKTNNKKRLLQTETSSEEMVVRRSARFKKS
ncbi:DNA glycosylase [Phascolomyces articulosus]|uniref:N-glycosylase/DNA lyase n=1 Tax=Phascolomyces articulosus TaxID=60185 RepID=A0AAD5PB40_9FUNG|nr:DNA glycosylase [Phascolomyces articulosus]